MFVRRCVVRRHRSCTTFTANNIRTSWRIYARCLAAKRDSAKLQAQLDTEKKQWDSYSKLQRQESAKLSRQLSVDLARAKGKEEDERAREAEHHRRKALTQVAREADRRKGRHDRHIEEETAKMRERQKAEMSEIAQVARRGLDARLQRVFRLSCRR